MLMYISEEFKVVQFLWREKKKTAHKEIETFSKSHFSAALGWYSNLWNDPCTIANGRQTQSHFCRSTRRHTETNTHSLTMSEWHGSRAVTSLINNTSPAPPNLEETERKRCQEIWSFTWTAFIHIIFFFLPLYLVSISLPFVIVHFQINPSLPSD